MKKRGLLAAAAFLTAACGQAPAPTALCPGEPEFDRAEVWKISDAVPAANVRHDLNIPGIVALRATWDPGAVSHVRGLTIGEYAFKTRYEIDVRARPGGALCLWIKSLDVDFSYSKLDVYVASDFPVGGCAYEALLKHEKQHADAHRRLHAGAVEDLRRSFAGSRVIPTRASSMAAKSEDSGKALIARLVSSATQPVLERFKKALDEEQGKLDSEDSYRDLGISCPDWK